LTGSALLSSSLFAQVSEDHPLNERFFAVNSFPPRLRGISSAFLS
jgi:hypothetical protein